MGHIINPVTHRMGYSRFWSNTWSLSAATSNSNYSYIASENIMLNNYLKKLFVSASRRLFGKGLLLLDLKILRLFNLTYIIFDVRMKQLFNLYRAIENTFLNVCTIQKLSFSHRRNTSLKNRGFNTNFSFNFKSFHNTKIIKRTTKLTNYNNSNNQPDLWSYIWTFLTKNLSLARHSVKTNLSKKVAPIILKSIISYTLYFYWLKLIKSIITTSLNKFYAQPAKLEVILTFLSNTSLSAIFIARYLAIRLLQKFPLRRLMSVLIRQLKRACESAIIHGFKIACNGRFERRGRATHAWKVEGKLPRSDVKTSLEYALMLPVLTNSICAVKVWITKSQQTEKLIIL